MHNQENDPTIKTFETYDGVTVIIDAEDYDKVKDYKWRFYRSGLIRARTGTNGKKLQKASLGHLIANVPEDARIYYINGNIFDNRKSNINAIYPNIKKGPKIGIAVKKRK
jgi:hypothetical protein